MAHAPLDIDLPGPTRRPYGLLLDASPHLPEAALSDGKVANRWMLAGVTWVAWGCGDIEATTEEACTALAPLDFDRGFGDGLWIGLPFMLWDAAQCSDLSVTPEWLRERILTRLEVFASAKMATELLTGDLSQGLVAFFNSPDASLGNTAETIRVGFAKLEASLAAKLHGAVGMIHVTPSVLGLALADGLIFMGAGDVYRTASGHVVVGDAGYTGTVAPVGGSAATSSQAWIWSSGPVWHAISDVIGLREAEENLIERNTESFYGRRYAMLAFDRCTVSAVKVTVA